ncbi:cohesin subunit SA-2-like isoform X2 [Ctenocephalides felis]|uniref:cohesin subunit SA-2-like isoform X2 n=1 Tax=Ctenocephalides felis TaxID=7515 RepID=UPI000E6E418F|nr:cohesin subunit SA-2-like isoform X2 [Ctenocephalides felis]
MFSPNRKIAVAAGTFFYNVFVILDQDSNGAGFGVRWFRHVTTSIIELKGLNSISYLVFALVANTEIMKDWDSMIHILIREHDEPLTPIPQPQEILIEIMFWCAASLSSTGERGTDNMVPSIKQKKMKKDKSNMTKYLMPVMATLLARFKSNVNCIIHLIKIPQYFDFDNTIDMEDLHLRNLLGALQAIAQDSADATVLDNCSNTLHCLSKRARSIAADCDVAIKTIVDKCAFVYMEPYITWLCIVDGQMDPKCAKKEDFPEILNSLKKIYIFQYLYNVNYLNIWEDFLEEFKVFRNGVIERNLPIEGSIYCLLSYGAYLSWALIEVKKMDLNNMVVNAIACMEQADMLKLKLKNYIEICKDIVQNVSHNDLQQAALFAICTLAANFNVELADHKNPILHDLVLKLSSDDVMLINKYAEEYVFLKHWTGTHEEDQVQIKKRREVLERFCKLIEFGIIPVTSASFVLMYYVKCEKCYGDIIKKMVATMCSLSRTNCTTVMFLTLKENYLQVESSCAGDVVNKTIEGFVQLKTLAAHLAKFLGTNKLKNRQAVAKLHEAGILFAVEQSGSPNVPPHRLPFLEILTKFSAKLEEEDRSSVFKYLQSRSGVPSRIPSGAIWAPYRAYRRSLIGSKPDIYGAKGQGTKPKAKTYSW